MNYSDYEYLKVETADRVATLTINRPDVLNAVNSRMHHEIEQIWLDLAADQDVNAIMFTGAGRAFCAGGDVKGMAAGQLVGGGPGGDRFNRGPITAANGRYATTICSAASRAWSFVSATTNATGSPT